ncbi:MAG: DUF2304 domain-containing protein [Nanoarchaeota archaeon]|nr:DUF2304 domain-containing protein [Nanoarchaeota archaeon]MBU1631656.1 DUF2304 domain-containing protein [Nanoarchaeota archaeon]MBU1875754.1 DUF2304 domain-containing protein [Nanoarchaeota archaeon]
MSILGIQIVGILFALFMFYLTFLHRRRKEFTIKEYIFWAGVWVIFLLLVLFPTTLDSLVKNVLSLSRRMDFFIIMGFMFLIGVVFHIYTIVRKTQNKIEKIVRQIAVEKEMKNKKKNNFPS